MKQEVWIFSLLLVAFVILAIYLPTFFVVALAMAAIWFFLALGNGYKIWATLALFAGTVLLLLSYPFDQTESDQTGQVLSLAASVGVSGEVEPIADSGSETVFLVRQGSRAALVRTLEENVKAYDLAQISKDLREKNYAENPDKYNQFLLADFKESYPLKYGLSFMLLLLPLFLVAVLPSRKKEAGKKVFDTRDGSLVSWFLPDGPSQDTKAITGGAGVQVIFALGLVMTIAFLLQIPSLSYLF